MMDNQTKVNVRKPIYIEIGIKLGEQIMKPVIDHFNKSSD